MRETDEQEFLSLVLELFHDDSDVGNAIDHWLIGGYSDKELLCLLTMAKHKAEKNVEAYFEETNREKRYNDAADDEEHA